MKRLTLALAFILCMGAGAFAQTSPFFLAFSQTGFAAGQTSIVITKPAGTAENDILIANIVVATGITVTPPASWTQFSCSPVTQSSADFHIYWKRATSSEGANYTWTFASTGPYGAIVAYTGASISGDPSDAPGTCSTASATTSFVATGLTTVTPNTTGILFLGELSAGGAPTYPAGFSADHGDVGNSFGVVDKVFSSPGATGNLTTTTFASDSGAIFFVALKDQTPNIIIRNGQCSATATSCTLNNVATNDLVISFAFRSGNVTPPTNPGGETSITSVATASGGTPGSFQVSCRLATSSGDTGSGTFTNATAVAALAFSNTRYSTTANCPTDSLGVSANANAKTSATESYSSLSAFTGTANSWVVAFDGNTGSTHCAPTGTTAISTTGTVSSKDSESIKTSWSVTTCSTTSATWMTWIAEIRNTITNSKATTDRTNLDDLEFSARVHGLPRTAFESGPIISDFITRLFTSTRSAAEIGSINYYGVRSQSASRAVAESSFPNEYSTVIHGLIRSYADSSPTLSDISFRSLGLTRATTDLTVGAELGIRLFTGARSAAESPLGSQAQTRLLSYLRLGADSSTGSELSSRLTSYSRSFSDQLFPSADKSVHGFAFARVGAETIALSDLSSKAMGVVRTGTDNAAGVEKSVRLVSNFRSAVDQILSPEKSTRVYTGTRLVTENGNPIDLGSRSVSNTRLSLDAAVVLEVSSRSVITNRQYTEAGTEALAMNDIGTYNRSFTRTATEARPTADSVFNTHLPWSPVIALNHQFASTTRRTQFDLRNRDTVFTLSPRVTEFMYVR